MIDTLQEDVPAGPLYICGPMTGYPDFNRANFNRIAEAYRQSGYTVVSPVELDEAAGVDYENTVHEYNDEYNEFLRRDLVHFLEAGVKALVVLEGWEESRGAALEVHVARSIGLPVYDEDGLLVKAPSKYKPPTDENILEEAERLVGGDRQEAYGHPIEDFARTAGAINALFGTQFEARDIPVLMICVKLSRVIQSPQKRDSFVDICGYARTREMVAEREELPLR